MAKTPTSEDRVAALEGTRAAYRIRNADFCAKAGIASSTWCRWKNGATSPRAAALDDAEDAMRALVAAVRAGRP